MPPPPIPVDPALDNDNSWNRDNNFSFPPVPGLFPPFEERAAYQYQIGGNIESMQDVLPPCRRQDDLDISPMVRFYEEPGPWNAHNVEPPSSAPPYHGLPSQINRIAMSSQIQPRSCDRSEVSSSTTGRNLLGSGYDSKSYATKSVPSCSEYRDRSQDCQSLVSDVGDLQMQPEDQLQGEDPDSLQNDSHPYGMNDGSTSHAPLLCPFPECRHIKFRNQSDQK